MDERERLTKLIADMPREQTVPEMVDYLLESGVTIIDERTALAMNAGARAIERNGDLIGVNYVFNPFEEPKEIAFSQAAKILRKLAEKALAERSDKE